MGTWEAIALTALGVLIVLLYRPGLRAAFDRSRQAQNQDWQNLLGPMLLVVLFVILLVAVAKSTSSKRTVQPGDLIDTRFAPISSSLRWT